MDLPHSVKRLQQPNCPQEGGSIHSPIGWEFVFLSNLTYIGANDLFNSCWSDKSTIPCFSLSLWWAFV